MVTPIAPYEALYTTLAQVVDPVGAFRRLAEIPIPLHVMDHGSPWVEDAPPGATDNELARRPPTDQGRPTWQYLPAEGRGIWRKCGDRWVRFMVARPITARNRAALQDLVRYLALRASSSCDEYRVRLEWIRARWEVPGLDHCLAMVNYRRLGQALYNAVRPPHELAVRALTGDGG